MAKTIKDSQKWLRKDKDKREKSKIDTKEKKSKLFTRWIFTTFFGNIWVLKFYMMRVKNEVINEICNFICE